MAKLYFKYGVMGCSKSASALMCKYNYEQKGFNVVLFKSLIDNRFENDDSQHQVISRIGLKSKCLVFDRKDNFIEIYEKLNKEKKVDVIIVDECQFATKEQINQLKDISEFVPVLCYGLKTNFKTELFEGSKRLIEIADSIKEIKSVCKCGKKAIINARIINGKIVNSGAEILIGAEEKYEALCYQCYKKKLLEDKKNEKIF